MMTYVCSRGFSSHFVRQCCIDREMQTAILLATLLVGSESCSPVRRLEFRNYCSHDVTVRGWNHVVKAGSKWSTTKAKAASNRIEFKYTHGSSSAFDFIELNSQWSGPGSSICGHPSYSSYNGYNMASKYEALNAGSRRRHRACSDPGAEVDYTASHCPTGRGNGYLCKGNVDCSSAYSRYIKDHSWAVNRDGSRSHTFKDVAGGRNYANFWCNEVYGFHSLVATMTGCVDHNVPIVLRVTTCRVSRRRRRSSHLNFAQDANGNSLANLMINTTMLV